MADGGGSLGLFLGASFLTFLSLIGRLLNHFCKKLVRQIDNETLNDMKNQSDYDKSVDVTVISGAVSERDENAHKPTTEEAIMTNKKSRSEHAEKIWEMSVTLILVMLTSLHALSAISAFIGQLPMALTSIGKESQPFPGITICSDMPFKAQTLNDFGINISNIACHRRREIILNELLSTLPGIWENNVSLRTLWGQGARDLEEIITAYAYSGESKISWKPIQTTNNVCYQTSSENPVDMLQSVSLTLSVTSKDLVKEKDLVGAFCYSSQRKRIWILITDWASRPQIIAREKTYSYSYKKYGYGQILHLYPLVIKRVKPCLSLPYKRLTCLHNCQLKAAAKKIRCSLPYLNSTSIPVCTTQESYEKSIKFIVNTDSSTFKETSDLKECEKSCPKECYSRYYLREQIKDENYVNEFYRIIFKVKHYIVINEIWPRSISGLMCEVGGIVGLYLGWSVLDASNTLIAFLPAAKATLTKGGKRHLRNIYSLVSYAFFLMVAAVLWSECTRKYIWDHPYHTSYSMESIRTEHFPSLTVCRWPPFNLSRLVEIGVEYDHTQSCSFNGRFYRCLDPTIVLRELPGVWNLSVNEVWEATAWHLEDLVSSYTLAGREFRTGSSGDAEGMWTSVLTEYNRCFTFTPRSKDHISSYTITLRTDYRGMRRPQSDDTTTLLHHGLRLGNPSCSILRIHAAGADIYRIPTTYDNVMEYTNSHESSSIHYTVDLTLQKQLYRNDNPCETSPNYTKVNCISKCMTSLTAKERGCRLPYLFWDDHPLCNNSYDYSVFPRQMGKISVYHPIVLGGGYTQDMVETRCRRACRPACTEKFYNVKSRFSRTTVNQIIVSFSGKTHDVLVERDGYTWGQFVSDIGGVGGFMLGFSLLSFLQTLVQKILKCGWRSHSGTSEIQMTSSWRDADE